MAVPSSSRSALLGLLCIVFVRMFGLFLVVPVIALYAKSLPDATPLHIGLALGVYGLTQAILQIPFGALSDKYGRKQIIGLGLAIFIIGSIICALTTNIYGLIFGRAMQGAGAISAAIMAFLADVTSENNRTKAMALFGISIGCSFLLAIITAPVLQYYVNTQGLFWLAAMLGGFALAILFFALPNTNSRTHGHLIVRPKHIIHIINDSQLWRLDISVMLLHSFLAMLFIALPLLLSSPPLGFKQSHMTWVYGPVLVASIFIMAPMLIIAERKQKAKQIMLLAVSMLGLGFLFLWLFGANLLGIESALLIFFAAFNVLEASLPSWVSKVAPQQYKGTIMGVFSTSQFLGVFLGGSLGGLLIQYGGISSLFLVGIGISIFWLWLTYSLPMPNKHA